MSCTLLITDIKEGVPWGVHQFLKFLVQQISRKALRIHIRNGFFSRWTGFLWSFSSISKPRSSPDQLQVNSRGFQSENQSRGLHQTAASKPKKVGRVKTCQNPDVTVSWLGGFWNHGMDYDFPIILGSCHPPKWRFLHHFSEFAKSCGFIIFHPLRKTHDFWGVFKND